MAEYIPSRSVPELLGDLVGQISGLFRKEVQLARAEIGEKLGQAIGGIAFIAVGGVLLLASLIVLLQAVVHLVIAAGLPPWAANLVVAVVVALVGYLLLRGGIGRLNASSLAPRRTMEQISRDAAIVKEQVR